VRHGLAQDERRNGQQEADVHPEVDEQRLVDAARQDPARIQGPADQAQSCEQGEEHGPSDDAEAPRRHQSHLPLQPKRRVVDEGQFERRIGRLRVHDARRVYFTV
jgi:hypothetical protein